MSHFVEMTVNFLQKNEKDLVKALEECFGKGTVEVHEQGGALFGYQGDNRSTLSRSNASYAPLCHIIIRKKNVGSASNDIGFRRNDEGTYTAFVSDYDKHSNFAQAKQDKVMQNYTLSVTERELKLKGYSLKKIVNKDGTIKLIGTRFG